MSDYITLDNDAQYSLLLGRLKDYEAQHFNLQTNKELAENVPDSPPLPADTDQKLADLQAAMDYITTKLNELQPPQEPTNQRDIRSQRGSDIRSEIAGRVANRAAALAAAVTSTEVAHPQTAGPNNG